MTECQRNGAQNEPKLAKLARYLALILILNLLCLATTSRSLFVQVQAQNLVQNKSILNYHQLIRQIEAPQDSIFKPSDGLEPNRRQIKLTVNESDPFGHLENKRDVCDVIFHQIDSLHGKTDLLEIGLMALETKLRASFYSDFAIHKYDNYDEMKLAGGPMADQELCLAQLEHLIERSSLQMKTGYKTTDINLFQLFDTHGRNPPGLMLGDTFWPGEYEECLRLKIETPSGPTPTRYCILAIRQPLWPRGGNHEIKALKAGTCLPKSCDSTNYKNKFELIQRMLEYQLRPIDKDQGKLVDLYCLPDEDSQLRAWYRAPATLLTVLALAGWLSLLAVSTYRYELMKRRPRPSASQVAQKEQRFGYSTGFDVAEDPSESLGARESRRKSNFRFYKTFAVTHNLRQLFRTDKGSSLMDAGAKMETAQQKTAPTSEQLPSSSSSDSDESLERNPVGSSAPSEERIEAMTRSIVDIRVIEGIKVISMSYVIMGHVLMSASINLANGRSMADSTSPVYLLANLMPAFAVNSFFVITGLLTSYLLFKQNLNHSFITNPFKWFAFIVYRYLRIMPMYVLVVLYAKTLSKYMGAGPFWDYGTTALGQRRTCEQESWWVTLLFGANFKSPLEHCIPSAWYLANDFQFFMVTPIFLAALHKNPAFGKFLLKFSILASYLWGTYAIATAETEDLTPVVKFSPHGFKTFVSNLAFSYTRPHHRIPAYLCGLLIGYTLYCFEQDQIKLIMARARGEKGLESPGWSRTFVEKGSLVCMLLVAASALMPTIGSRLPFNEFTAKLAVAIVTPTFHIIFASAVGLYTLLATTGYGNQTLNAFLSAKFFKPFARLSLCVVLINIEVVVYFVQTSTHVQHINNRVLMSMNFIGIVITYAVAVVVCVLFEAPIRNGLNHLLQFAIKKMAAKVKQA